MDGLILSNVFEDDMMEILPPEPKTCAAGMVSSCDCCGPLYDVGPEPKVSQ
ncbi:hypothetical protein ACC719_11545 [Rhizobium ruizarguesonis]